MPKPFEPISDEREELRKLVLGLGERSFRKSWYPELQTRIDELERFRSLIDCTVEAILLVHAGTLRIVDANRTAVELFGASLDDFESRPIADFVPQEVLERIARGVQTDSSTVLLVQWPTIAKERQLESSVRFSGQGSQVHAIVMVRDVTERLALERQALTSQRLESVGRLAAGIAHDFNNLLGAIVGTVDLVRELLPPESESALDLQDAILVAKRAALLTRRLMSFSRQGAGKPTLVNLAHLANELERLLARVTGERARLVMDLNPDGAWVLADPIALEQVIVNLVSNARDAVSVGGTITLRVLPDLEGATAEAQPFCLLEVEDDGIGMDEDTQGRVFEPFFTTKPVNKGTGLGLSVVANVVAQCGGRIELHSELGKGTRFSLRFPKGDKPSSTQPPVVKTNPQIQGVGRLVLVVEDEKMLRSTIERTLQRRGFEVVVAEDVEDALFRVRRCRQTPALLISDVVLPDGTGLDVVEQVRAKWSDIPILLISGYIGEETTRIGEPGLENLLLKPFTPQVLMERVAQVFARG